MLWLIGFSLLLSFSQAQQCFHPERDRSVQKMLVPNQLQLQDGKYTPAPLLKEDGLVIKKIHAKIREVIEKYQFDPRLVYARMFGESFADPSQVGPGGFYGLFQIGDNAPLKDKCRDAKSQRLCQVEYYVDVYMKKWADHASTGCLKGKRWDQYPLIDKYSYLNSGTRCGGDFWKTEQRQALSHTTYSWTGAGNLISQVFNWTDPRSKTLNPRIPLCHDYLYQQISEPLPRHMDKVSPSTPLTI